MRSDGHWLEWLIGDLHSFVLCLLSLAVLCLFAEAVYRWLVWH